MPRKKDLHTKRAELKGYCKRRGLVYEQKCSECPLWNRSIVPNEVTESDKAKASCDFTNTKHYYSSWIKSVHETYTNVMNREDFVYNWNIDLSKEARQTKLDDF